MDHVFQGVLAALALLLIATITYAVIIFCWRVVIAIPTIRRSLKPGQGDDPQEICEHCGEPTGNYPIWIKPGEYLNPPECFCLKEGDTIPCPDSYKCYASMTQRPCRYCEEQKNGFTGEQELHYGWVTSARTGMKRRLKNWRG